jgi:hypothetical protein
MKYYKPKDELSTQLLVSIPRKVAVWLNRIGMKSSNGKFMDLSWKISGQQSIIKINDIEIRCNGKIDKLRNPHGTEPWFENLSANLDQFVELERIIYNVLFALEQDLEAQ